MTVEARVEAFVQSVIEEYGLSAIFASYSRPVGDSNIEVGYSALGNEFELGVAISAGVQAYQGKVADNILGNGDVLDS